jgi:ubiquinone/menaquinone biosynthesis C-methylase UbiE
MGTGYMRCSPWWKDWSYRLVGFTCLRWQAEAWLLDQLHLSEGTRVLDIACGNGRIGVHLRRRGIRYIGVDLALASLRKGQNRTVAMGSPLDLAQSDVAQLPFPAQSMDTVICLTAFEHFEQDDCVLDEVYRVLRPGGMLVISVYNEGVFGHYGITKAFLRLPLKLRQRVASHYVLNARDLAQVQMGIRERFEHIHSITPENLQARLERHRFMTRPPLFYLNVTGAIAVELGFSLRGFPFESVWGGADRFSHVLLYCLFSAFTFLDRRRQAHAGYGLFQVAVK